jgi:molybdopterin converting factor small subunit
VKSILFVIPGPLREFAAGRGEVRLTGDPRSLSEALALLWSRHPGVKDRVVNELGEIRTHINVFLDGENIRRAGGLDAPVKDGSEIVILPAVSGGAEPSRVEP